MVAAAAITHGLVPPNSRVALVDKPQLTLSNVALSVLNGWHKSINGLTPTISCECTNVSNLYTLTPLNVSPLVIDYFSFMSFAFVASATSTGLITAKVVTNGGSDSTITLPTIKVMKTNGSTQATAGDITINLFYVMYYVDTLDAGAGAFVIK